MKKNYVKNACFSLAFMLCLGLAQGPVMAEENGAISTTAPNAVAETVKPAALFSARVTAPSTDNAYYFADNAYYQGGYGMPNCTAYAWGRAYEILGSRPNLCTGNANEWWDYNLSHGYYPCGSTPKLGAIICWGSGSSGHVAVVESIVGDTVTLSESTFSGIYFQNYSYTIGAEDATSVGGFQGYIYIGDYVDASSDVTPPSISDIQVSDVDEEGFTASCEVSDDLSGVAQVMFPVWTDNGGQDDLIWHVATVNGNTASCRISYAEHNGEISPYQIHAYVYDKAGLSAMTTTSIVEGQLEKAASFRSLGDVSNFVFPQSEV